MYLWREKAAEIWQNNRHSAGSASADCLQPQHENTGMACFPLCYLKMDSIRLWQALPIDITMLMSDNIFIWIHAGLIFQVPTFIFVLQSFNWTDFSKPCLNNQKQKLNWKWITSCALSTKRMGSLWTFSSILKVYLQMFFFNCGVIPNSGVNQQSSITWKNVGSKYTNELMPWHATHTSGLGSLKTVHGQ